MDAGTGPRSGHAGSLVARRVELAAARIELTGVHVELAGGFWWPQSRIAPGTVVASDQLRGGPLSAAVRPRARMETMSFPPGSR